MLDKGGKVTILNKCSLNRIIENILNFSEFLKFELLARLFIRDVLKHPSGLDTECLTVNLGEKNDISTAWSNLILKAIMLKTLLYTKFIPRKF